MPKERGLSKMNPEEIIKPSVKVGRGHFEFRGRGHALELGEIDCCCPAGTPFVGNQFDGFVVN